MGDIEQLLSV